MLPIPLVLALSFFSPVEEEHAPLEWLGGAHAAVLEQARHDAVPVLTYFWADTENCRRMYAETLGADGAAEALAHLRLYSANAQTEAGRQLFEAFGLETVPALLVHDAQGEVAEVLLGYLDAVTLTAEIDRIARGENTIPTLRRALADPPSDLEHELEIRRMLSEKLLAAGQGDEARAMAASILQRDPKGATYPGAVARIQHEFHRFWTERGEQERDLVARDVQPLQATFARLENPRGRFSAFSDLGDFQVENGLAREGVGTWTEAWKARPKDDRFVIDAALRWIETIERDSEALTSKDRKFALKVARDLVALSAVAPETCAACEAGAGAEGAEANEEGDRCASCASQDEECSRMGQYVQYRLARCQVLNGQTDAAIETMKRLLEHAPGESDYAAYLGELRNESGG